MSKESLDYDDRINLQVGIAKGYSLKKIAKILGRSRPTIYRVIIVITKTIDILVVIAILIVTINYLIIEMGNHFITYISSSILQKNFVK